MTPRSRRRCASRAPRRTARANAAALDHHTPNARGRRRTRAPQERPGSRRDLEPGLRVDKRINPRILPLRTRPGRLGASRRPKLQTVAGAVSAAIASLLRAQQGVMSSSTALYRAFLRASVKLTNYNFRQYARRRARLGFEENRSCKVRSATKSFSVVASSSRCCGGARRCPPLLAPRSSLLDTKTCAAGKR